MIWDSHGLLRDLQWDDVGRKTARNGGAARAQRGVFGARAARGTARRPPPAFSLQRGEREHEREQAERAKASRANQPHDNESASFRPARAIYPVHETEWGWEKKDQCARVLPIRLPLFLNYYFTGARTLFHSFLCTDGWL